MQATDEDRRAAEEFAGLVYLSVLQHTALEKAFAAHRIASERRAYEKAAECAAGCRCQHCAYTAQAIRALATSEAPDTAPPSGR